MASHSAAVLLNAVLVGALAMAGCQKHELEPSYSPPWIPPRFKCPVIKRVPATGAPLPAYVVFVVDKSGSMTEPAAGGASCSAVGKNYDPSSYTDSANYVRCKWNELRAAFADPTKGILARLDSQAAGGLVLYPSGSTCETGRVDVPIGGSAQAVVERIDSTVPAGGTPTADSLLAVLSDPRMAVADPDRDRIVALITDGAPNCNDAYAELCSRCLADPSVCWNDGECRPVNDPCNAAFAGMGCLDESGAVAAVQTLRDRGIRTFVIGLGIGSTADPVAVSARKVLNAMAQAGGMARDSEPYFAEANDRDGLALLFEAGCRISPSPCNFLLDPPGPSSPAQLHVVFVRGDGTESVLVGPRDPSGATPEWSLYGDVVTIEGARCAEIRDATAAEGLVVEVRSSCASL